MMEDLRLEARDSVVAVPPDESEPGMNKSNACENEKNEVALLEEDLDGEDEGLEGELVTSGERRGRAKRVTKSASGLSFKGYTSIENCDRQKVLQEINLMGYSDRSIEWVATEKVHGANFSFTTNGEVIECAKRTGLLVEGDTFYNFAELRERYRDKILKMFRLCKEASKHTNLLYIYGELMGGVYPHKDLPRSEVTAVQRGVYYCPHYEFYGFDIRTDVTKGYMDYDKATALFEECGFFHAKPLAIGPLEDLLKLPPAFPSTIPSLFNLPPLEKNTAEGLVLKPLKTLYFTSGSRVILKNKSEDFLEVTGMKKERVKKDHNVALPKVPENVATLRSNLLNYVTENRLRNVISKIGNGIKITDRGLLIGSFTRDALEDFMKDHGEEFNVLEPPQKKQVTGALAGAGAKLVNDNMVKIVRNEF